MEIDCLFIWEKFEAEIIFTQIKILELITGYFYKGSSEISRSKFMSSLHD